MAQTARFWAHLSDPAGQRLQDLDFAQLNGLANELLLELCQRDHAAQAQGATLHAGSAPNQGAPRRLGLLALLLTAGSSAGPHASLAELLEVLRDQAAHEQPQPAHQQWPPRQTWRSLQGWLASFVSWPCQQRTRRLTIGAACVLAVP